MALDQSLELQSFASSALSETVDAMGERDSKPIGRVSYIFIVCLVHFFFFLPFSRERKIKKSRERKKRIGERGRTEITS